MALLPLFLVSALFHAFVAWRLWDGLAAWPLVQAALAGWLALSCLLMPLALLARRRRRGAAGAGPLAWGGLVAMGAFSSMFAFTVVRDLALVLLLTADLLLPAQWPALPLARVGAVSALLVPLLALLATAWGAFNARRPAQIKRVDVPVAGLPEALHGFTIAQLSDVHVGPTIGARELSRMVERVNRLGADVVAVTGDLVDGSVADLAPHVAPLAGLRSRHGTFFVTGNHEYYSGALAWIDELRRLGVRVLLNEHVVIAHGDGARLVLAGVADYTAHRFVPEHRSDPAAALAGAPADAALRVLLAHQPRSAEAAAQAGFDLQISGHTHGGQFWPWNHFVRFQQPFTAGLARLGALWVYTSRGTGYWGPPKRLGAPAEITALRLVRA